MKIFVPVRSGCPSRLLRLYGCVAMHTGFYGTLCVMCGAMFRLVAQSEYDRLRKS